MMRCRSNTARGAAWRGPSGWLTMGGALALLAGAGACATGQAGFGGGGSTSTSASTSSGHGGGTAGGGGQTGGSGGSGASGACAIDCSSIQTPACQVAQCNAQTGQCEVVNDADGADCDDSVFCTVNDACFAGVCEGGPPNDCGLAHEECEKVSCDEGTESCSTEPVPNGSACAPTDLCQVNATCTNGLCIGQAKDCFFSPVPDECHVSVCNPQNGQCEPEPGNEGQGCIDPNELCTDGKTCDNAGNCLGGGPKDCSALTQGCLNGVCNPQTGQCEQQPVPPGGSCLSAADDCNVGECDNNGQCLPVPTNEGGSCEDGNPCTSGETCTAGVCGGGQMVTQVIYFEEDFADNGAGWTLDTEWQIASAQASSGQSYGNPDPAADHTTTGDNGVAGVVIGGNAATTLHSYYYLTSPSIDVSTVTGSLWLGFWRWLNSDYTPYMQNQVQVYDGSQWVTLWESGSSPGVQDNAWTQMTYDLSAYKSNQMRVRFGFQIGSSGVFTVSQWNVDDVQIANVICP